MEAYEPPWRGDDGKREMTCMKKVGICAHFGFGKELMNGQTDKSLAVWNALKKEYGEDQVAVLDTHGWQKHPAATLLGCRRLVKQCENVLMLPGRNGVKLFPRLFTALNRREGRRLHYVAIGGWLADWLKKDESLRRAFEGLDYIYVEGDQLKAALNRLGFERVILLPNFRNCRILAPGELVTQTEQPLKLCTFSRLEEEKGIEDAVEAVRKINRKAGKTVYTLDIYGNVEKKYEERFKELAAGFEPFVAYKGFVQGEESASEILRNYFAMLFPTYYHGEGFAGAIISAFAAGLPVIATDWRCNPEVIRDGVDGILYPTGANSQLEKILTGLAEHPNELNALKPNCLERAAHYSASNVIHILTRQMNGEEEADKEREAVKA